MDTITIDGRQIEYVDHPATGPAGAPLVLLHEGLGCVAMWRRFPEQLAAATGRRVIAWSRPGYGRSEPYEAARGLDYLKDEALNAVPRFLKALNVRRPILIGHSDGATLSLVFAGAYPKEVAGVVVMAPHEFVEEATLAGIRQACEAWESTDFPRRLAVYHKHAERVFREWQQVWLSPAYRDWSVEEYLPLIRCPVLAIQGEGDEYATMRQIEVIAEKTPGTELLKLRDCGHSPHRDQPQAVLEAITGFVARVDPPRG